MNNSPLKSQKSSTNNKFKNKEIKELTDEELNETIEVPTIEELVKIEQNSRFKGNHSKQTIVAYNKRAKINYDKDHEVSQSAVSK